ncbi:MAG: two-component sensor histidine kinase [Xanthomonadales bacterium]|nr:two-component sensor histidine kinase [Xanthomonadales bacterium]
MRSLLDGLLEYSRVRSRDMVLEQIRLNKPVADAMANLAVLIGEREAQITVAALPEVCGDGVQLMQLFQNLINNGIKFCSAPPPKIAIGAHREEGRWVVEVSDNGIGIAPAHYQKIFQIFSRLHSREAYPGTGVGLVCKQIMERLGGHIDVASMPGQGTTFKLCF